MPVRFNAMRNPLTRPQTFTEAGSPGNSRFRNVKSLVADSPSTSTFTTPAPRKTLRQATPRYSLPRTANSVAADSPSCIREPAKQRKPYGPAECPDAKTRRPERQARASPAASAGCAVFAKAGFLCDNKRHPFGEIIRPVGAAGAQVPYKHKVTGSNPVPATIETAGQTFFVWPFLFSGQPRAYRTKARLN